MIIFPLKKVPNEPWCSEASFIDFISPAMLKSLSNKGVVGSPRGLCMESLVGDQGEFFLE